MSGVGRNEPCACGSGRKYKRCCGPELESPAGIAREHGAAGGRVQDWAYDNYADQIAAGFDEVLEGRDMASLSEAEFQLAGTWVLSDRQLPGGGTICERYAQREDISAGEREVAGRIAAARLGLFKVISLSPGRSIELRDLTRDEAVSIASHNLSRLVRAEQVIVARLMTGPPALSVWGPVAFVTARTGPTLSSILTAKVAELGFRDQPLGLSIAMNSASREIVALLLDPTRDQQSPRAA